MESENTIKKIMNKMLKDIDIIKEGDYIETFQTIYSQDRAKDIKLDGKNLTIPLACTKEWKKAFLKQKSPLCAIYKDLIRGDILVVKKVLPNSLKIVVENLSIKEEYRKEFTISKEDIVKKNFSLVKRKSSEISKILEELKK